MPKNDTYPIEIKRRENCPMCGAKMVATPSASQRSEVGSSPWVEEWAAALRHTEIAVIMTPSTAMTDREWERSREALNTLRDIFDSMRSHSSTVRLNDSEPAIGTIENTTKKG